MVGPDAAAKEIRRLVEFAKLKHEEGKSIVEAALEGAKLRLRPILMTSFAFILGCVPLMLAKGSGAPYAASWELRLYTAWLSRPSSASFSSRSAFSANRFWLGSGHGGRSVRQA